MLKVGEVLTIRVGDDGRWMSFISSISTTSFDDRCAALEWSCDHLSKKVEVPYTILGHASKWESVVDNFKLGRKFVSREAALEDAVIRLASILKRKLENSDEKKRPKRKTS